MRFNQTRKNVATTLIFLLLLTFPSFAATPQEKSIVVSSNGDGVLKMGQEEFKVSAAVVKLIDDGTAEINLLSEITVFLEGQWSKTGDPSKGIDLKITGGAAQATLEGAGKLFLRDDGKSITSLKLQVFNKSTKRTIEVNFVGR